MDGSFACPECGSSVEVAGAGPRAAGPVRVLQPAARGPLPSPRGRSSLEAASVRPSPVVRLGVCVLGGRVGRDRLHWCRPIRLTRQYDSAQQRSINRLLDSSRFNEADGRLDQALIDLDTALEIARKAGPTYVPRIDDWAKKTSRPRSPRGPDLDRPPPRCRPRLISARPLAHFDRAMRRRIADLASMCRASSQQQFSGRPRIDRPHSSSRPAPEIGRIRAVSSPPCHVRPHRRHSSTTSRRTKQPRSATRPRRWSIA